MLLPLLLLVFVYIYLLFIVRAFYGTLVVVTFVTRLCCSTYVTWCFVVHRYDYVYLRLFVPLLFTQITYRALLLLRYRYIIVRCCCYVVTLHALPFSPFAVLRSAALLYRYIVVTLTLQFVVVVVVVVVC